MKTRGRPSLARVLTRCPSTVLADGLHRTGGAARRLRRSHSPVLACPAGVPALTSVPRSGKVRTSALGLPIVGPALQPPLSAPPAAVRRRRAEWTAAGRHWTSSPTARSRWRFHRVHRSPRSQCLDGGRRRTTKRSTPAPRGSGPYVII